VFAQRRPHGDLESHEDDVPGAVHYELCRLGVVPDVGLCGLRRVARGSYGAAHHHDPVDQARQLGFEEQRETDVGQRPDRDQCELTRALPGEADNLGRCEVA
jgi:hypothetical protein